MGTRSVEKEVDDENVGLEFVGSLNKTMMVLPQHHHGHHTHDPPASTSAATSWGMVGVGFDGSSTRGGPLLCGPSNQGLIASSTSDLHDDSTAVVMSNLLQSNNATEPFNHPGEIMTEAVNRRGVAFTAAQWQELERQTVIYHYMMASAPVPPELLMSITNNPALCTSVVGGGPWRFGNGSSNKNSDPEPWRCRRTDGKKWRCSRDAAPDQKYCERHSHKSRPRSRKPVELSPNLKSINPKMESSSSRARKSFHHQYANSTTVNQSNFPLHPAVTSSTPSSYDRQRGLRWCMKEEALSVLNPSDDMLSLGGILTQSQTRAGETLQFADAWSRSERMASLTEAACNDCSLAPEEKPPPSPLTLFMRGSDECESHEQQLTRQMFMRAQWTALSPPGGPLAEALCLGVPGSSKGTSSGCSGNTTNSSCSKSSS